MKNLFLIGSLLLTTICSSPAQVPVTVNRSTVLNGGSVVLPTMTGSGQMETGNRSGPANFIGGSCRGTPPWDTVGGSVVSTGAIMTGPLGGYYTLSWSGQAVPVVTIATNAPSVFTNGVIATINYSVLPGGETFSGVFSQQYAVTLVEDGGNGENSSLPTGTLTGLGNALESLSRHNPSTEYRKLLGFQLKTSTNATLTSLAVFLSNTTTNNPVSNNFPGIKLYQDADSNDEWDAVSDTEIAATTNATGYAIFNGLSTSLNVTNKTFFVAASFCPTNQTRNSFITGSLRSQNVICQIAGSNMVIETTGGTILGKQWAFLDTTVEEDAAANLALDNQIQAAVNSATHALGTTPVVSPSNTGLIDTILPAAAAGAAAIGAAFTSDSLGKTPISPEFAPPQ